MFDAYASKPSVALNSFTSPFSVCGLCCGSNGQGSVRNPDPPPATRSVHLASSNRPDVFCTPEC